MARSALAPLFVAVAACCLLAAAQAAQPRFQRIRSILTLGDSVADAGKLLLPALQAVAAHYRCPPSRASVKTKRHQTRALLTCFTVCLALDTCTMLTGLPHGIFAFDNATWPYAKFGYYGGECACMPCCLLCSAAVIRCALTARVPYLRLHCHRPLQQRPRCAAVSVALHMRHMTCALVAARTASPAALGWCKDSKECTVADGCGAQCGRSIWRRSTT